MEALTKQMRLNDAQMILLQLFQHRVMNSDELTALRDTLVLHLTKELDDEIEKNLIDKKIDFTDIEKNMAGLDQNRSAYKKQMKAIYESCN